MHRFQAVRHVAFGDTQRQPFHQRGFAHPRFSHQNRVVFAATGEDIDHLANFRVAPEYRVDSPAAGFFRHVFGKAVKHRQQGVILFLRQRFCRCVRRCRLRQCRGQRFGDLWLTCRTFIRLRIQQGTQPLKLHAAQTQQYPQVITGGQHRFFCQCHQQVLTADLRGVTFQRGYQPRLSDKRRQRFRKLRTFADRAG